MEIHCSLKMRYSSYSSWPESDFPSKLLKFGENAKTGLRKIDDTPPHDLKQGLADQAGHEEKL